MGRFDSLTQLETKPTPEPVSPPVELPRKPGNPKSRIPENMKPSFPETLKTGKPENNLSGKPENLKTRLPENPKAEKYSTQLPPSLIKRIKQQALEQDIKDYEVVQFALEAYLTRKK
jgi:hypothetical protein